MTFVLRVLGSSMEGLFPPNDPKRYLERGDVDAHDGRGFAELTEDVDKAIAFDDAGEAMRYWRRRSKVRPFRADGMPNRPLMAFTVEVVKR